MTREEIFAYQREMKAFGETRAGRALFAYEKALGRAWITDQRENASIRSMERDWKASDEARAELIQAIQELQEAREAAK
jgi:hypothetical protein